MRSDPEPRVPDISLERYRLQELPPGEADRVKDRLRHDEALRRRLAALERSDDAILREYPPDWLTGQIRQRLAARDHASRPSSRVAAYWAIPAGVLVAALLLIAIVPRVGPFAANSGGTSDAGDRIKGLSPALTVYRQTADGSETLADGTVAHAGDVVRVGYRAAGRRYGLILSVDGRAVVTMHLPPQGDRAAALERESTVLLDQAYELDDAPRWERFYFITGDTPFAVAPIVDAAHRAAIEGQPPRALSLPRGLEQSSFALQKESRP